MPTKLRYDEDQLWPIAYASKTKSKTHGLRAFNDDDLNNNRLPQIYTETQAPPVVLPAAQRDTYVQPQITAAPYIPAPAVASIPLVPTYAIQPTYTVSLNF